MIVAEAMASSAVALADARWTREAWTFLANLHPEGGERRAVGHKNPGQSGRRPEQGPGVSLPGMGPVRSVVRG